MNPRSFDLIIWHIPANIDPTFHKPHALRFDELSKWIRRVQREDRCEEQRYGDLREIYRGWALSEDGTAVNGHTATSIHQSDDAAPSANCAIKVDDEPLSLDTPNDRYQNQDPLDQPTERTHVFLIWWKDEEAGIRFKDPWQQGIAGGLGKLGRLEWKTGFEDMQEIGRSRE